MARSQDLKFKEFERTTQQCSYAPLQGINNDGKIKSIQMNAAGHPIAKKNQTTTNSIQTHTRAIGSQAINSKEFALKARPFYTRLLE